MATDTTNDEILIALLNEVKNLVNNETSVVPLTTRFFAAAQNGELADG